MERYHLRFNGSRVNEDYGYNLAVDLLCDNDNEKLLALAKSEGYKLSEAELEAISGGGWSCSDLDPVDTRVV